MSQVSILPPKKTQFPRSECQEFRGLCIDFVFFFGGPFYFEISYKTTIGRFGRFFFWINNTEAHEALFLSLRQPSFRTSSGEIEGSYV